MSFCEQLSSTCPSYPALSTASGLVFDGFFPPPCGYPSCIDKLWSKALTSPYGYPLPMPPRRKGKETSSKSRMTRTTRASDKPNDRKPGKNLVDDSTPVLAPPRGTRSGTRSGLRSEPSAESALPFEDNPELILRKRRKSQKSIETEQAKDRSEIITHASPETPSQYASRLPTEEYGKIDHGSSDEGSAEDTDTEEKFNRRWGYLPPLDEEALAIIEAIIADPEMAKSYTRISPDHINFPNGLEDRNVLLEESQDADPQSDRIILLAPEELAETDGEKESHGQLWDLDQAKCNKGSNEALFQRTLMMSLISRHRLIYVREPTTQRLLDFSVEEPWSCPPMPTRAYWKGESFLTQPKPDLAVCFVRKALIPNHLWNIMPRATKRLACYESAGEIGSTRVFHFFTIEAKKAKTSTGDTVGMRQSLNNASQALHNMFEFFKEAGPHQEDIFFDKVRFFSVVASTEGVAIRIHRATREPASGSEEGFIIPGYPLRFEYKEFCSIPRDKFERKAVLETFQKILLSYGVKELHTLLQDAAKSVVERLRQDGEGMRLRGNENFYRYKQTAIPPSKRATPATSRAQSEQVNFSFESLQDGRAIETPSSAQIRTNISIDMSRTGITTPGQDVSQTPSPTLNFSGKRSSENNTSPRRVRQRNQS